MALEHEFKWAAKSPADFKLFKTALDNAKREGVLSIYDVYFDNKDGYYGKLKTSCRIRREDGRYILTLKSDTKIENGLAVREEKNTNLKAQNLAQAKKEALKYLPAGGIKKIFSIKNKRENYLIKKDFHAVLSFDNCAIKTKKHCARLFEIEMEFVKGDKKAFDNFTKFLSAKTGFKHAALSKVETALSLLRKEAAK